MQSSQQCSQNNCVQRLTEWTLLVSWKLSKILLRVTKYISSVVVTVLVSKCLTKPKYKEANKNAVVASTWWLYYDQFDEAMQKKIQVLFSLLALNGFLESQRSSISESSKW